jgi:hypothetical protein
MTDHVDPTWSEDQLIELLCGQFGGISTSILQDAMTTTASHDMKSDNEVEDSTDEVTMPGTPVTKNAVIVFEGQMSPLNRSVGVQSACEALSTVIDNIIIASRLESINEEVGYGAHSKVCDDICLPYRGNRARQA